MPRNKKDPSRKDSIINSENPDKTITEAHIQAEEDIEKDPDLNSTSSKEDDLDEGELARLEGED